MKTPYSVAAKCSTNVKLTLKQDKSEEIARCELKNLKDNIRPKGSWQFFRVFQKGFQGNNVLSAR